MGKVRRGVREKCVVVEGLRLQPGQQGGQMRTGRACLNTILTLILQ